ncbi:hypothetical protein CEXT_15481 [Caerostris extrusa]|uniref:Uncharacterized protein n=1 Tax=Caerostris extrusa TaxID=172846 RepID=A0AAV4WAC6_CAEEX|nr:hypothetical protein CEXT_15481 [Caerostris extrusa]
MKSASVVGGKRNKYPKILFETPFTRPGTIAGIPASLEANVTNIRRFFPRRLSHAGERSPEWKIAIPSRGNLVGASEEGAITTVCLQGPCLCTPLGRASLTTYRNNKSSRPLLVGGGRFLSAI